MNIINKIKNSDFIKDISITTIGQIIVMICTFLLNKIISSKLGPEQYMEYSLIHKTAGVITYVMILSLGIALPRYMAIYRSKKDREREYACFLSSIILMLISTGIVFLFCILFKNQFALVVFGKNEKYVSYVFPTLMLALQMGLTTMIYSFYRGTDKFFMYSFSQCVVSVGLMVISMLTNKLLVMVYIMSIFGVLFSSYLFFVEWKKYKKKKYSTTKKHLIKEVKVLAKYSVPRVPGEFILFSFTTVPLIIINQRIGPQEAVAFSVALGIISAISPFFRYIGLVLLPYASKNIAQNNFDDLDRKMKYLTIVYLLISCCGIIFVLLFTKIVIIILYSLEYIRYASIVRIMIFSLLPNAIYLLLRNPLDALTKFPVNTINLVISFLIMNIIIYFSNSEVIYAISFFVAYTVLGILSLISWMYLKKKYTEN